MENEKLTKKAAAIVADCELIHSDIVKAFAKTESALDVGELSQHARARVVGVVIRCVSRLKNFRAMTENYKQYKDKRNAETEVGTFAPLVAENENFEEFFEF